jgi:DNA-binding transcriptional LysR family regulator
MTDRLTAIVGDLGLGVLPCSMGDAAPEWMRLTRPPVATSKLSLVYRKEAKLARPIRSAAELVVANMQQHASRLHGRLPSSAGRR